MKKKYISRWTHSVKFVTSCVARERLNPEEKSKRYLPRSVAFLTRISLCGNVSEEFHHQVPKEQDAVSSAASIITCTEPSLENQALLIGTNAIFTGKIILTYIKVTNENKKSET